VVVSAHADTSGTPDGDEETPFETHPRVRDGRAYTDLVFPAQAALIYDRFRLGRWADMHPTVARKALGRDTLNR
jgi:hypothetical protein